MLRTFKNIVTDNETAGKGEKIWIKHLEKKEQLLQ